MFAKYPGTCDVCKKPIKKGTVIYWLRRGIAWHDECNSLRQNMQDPEYTRGHNDVRQAQEAGPAGSAAREAAYMEMEQRWAREGFDG
jgi:hypothetical protein